MGLGWALAGCKTYPNCAVDWQPNVRQPVFYGHRDFGTKDGAPGDFRVFYPSAEGSPPDAPILAGCGHYPVVVFAHGVCSEPDHYKKWFRLPAGLARSGYVVVVPRLPAIAAGVYPWADPHPDLALLKDVLKWMHKGWESSPLLLSPVLTGIVGHSYGALLGLRLALEVPASAYVSLSGVWAEWPPLPPLPLKSLGVPKLFTWGQGFGDVFAMLEGGAAVLWNAAQPFKHSVRFPGAGHWDYLATTKTTCVSNAGPCNLVESVAADFVTTFMSKYMPPDDSHYVTQLVPDNLVPPPLTVTKKQQPYAGAHLPGFSQLFSQNACTVVEAWVSTSGPGGPVTLPGP